MEPGRAEDSQGQFHGGACSRAHQQRSACGGGSGSSLHGSLESSLPPASPSLLVLPFFSLDPSVAPVLGW